MPNANRSETWVTAIYMLVRNRSGRVLLLRRGQTVKHFRGCWELPGGKPAPGEELAKTAELEVCEEAGLYAAPTGVAGAVEGRVPGKRVVIVILEGRAKSSKVTLSQEHDAYQWLPLDQVGALKLRPGFDRFFSQYSAQQSRKRGK